MMDIKTLYNIYLQHPDVITDSRLIKPRAIFFALKGDNFDGNDFALKALENGCSYAVVDREEGMPEDDRLIKVADVLTTLQQLAQYHREQLTIPVIGITGTNGKTTTKELISSVLIQKYNVCFTKGNFNNHIGVPLTLLSINNTHDIAVVEMGANHPGEIEFLCSLVKPTHGVITNVGIAHLEGFGSLEGVINTKRALYTYLYEHSGKVFINMSDERLTAVMKRYYPQWPINDMITYSALPNYPAKVCGTLVDAAPFVEISLIIGDEQQQITTHLVGAYNINNIMVSVAVGREFGVNETDIANAIIDYVPTNNRSQYICTDKNRIIVDAYNANPTSMAAALTNFANIRQTNKVLILGDMLELGEGTQEQHRIILDKIEQLFNLQDVKLLLVGSIFNSVKEQTPCLSFETEAALEEWLSANSLVNSTILIKGSNGIGLAKLVKTDLI